jgi:intein-encoded DNA endonuclease-like protein
LLLDRREFEKTDEKLAYARGYFDAEGGIPQNSKARFYIQLVQKNLSDITELRTILDSVGISCGKLHNPSHKVDSDLWRFYVLAASQRDFAEKVSSWHPRKRVLLDTFLETA